MNPYIYWFQLRGRLRGLLASQPSQATFPSAQRLARPMNTYTDVYIYIYIYIQQKDRVFLLLTNP